MVKRRFTQFPISPMNINAFDNWKIKKNNKELQLKLKYFYDCLLETVFKKIYGRRKLYRVKKTQKAEFKKLLTNYYYYKFNYTFRSLRFFLYLYCYIFHIYMLLMGKINCYFFYLWYKIDNYWTQFILW